MVGGFFLGETRRVGDAPLGVGGAPRRPYDMVGRDFWGVALLRRGDASRGATHRSGRRTAGGGDAPQWAARRVAPTIRYDFWGAASLRPTVASLRPTVASLRPNVASLRPTK